MTRGSPDGSRRRSRGRSKKGRATTAPSRTRGAARSSIVWLEGQEHDVFGRHGRGEVLTLGPGAGPRVELVDAERLRSRSKAMLGDLAEVGRAFDRAGHDVVTRRGGLRRRQTQALGTNRYPYVGAGG